MSNLDVIKDIYKPYKITLLNKCIIFESTLGKYVAKESSNKNLKELYAYLNSRNFNNYIPIIEEDRTSLNISPYIDEIYIPIEQKADDLINVISNLHYKTAYFKDVSQDKYMSIYENIDNNIKYILDKYDILFKSIENKIYYAPDEYLLIRNSSKIKEAILFCQKELERWYELVKDERKQRVCLIHNNLSLDHFIKGDNDYLISFDKSTTDTPIKDLLILYKNVYFDTNFTELFKNYNASFPLLDNERILFFILISIPSELVIENDRFKNIINIRLILDYIYKTELFIKDFYIEEKDI